MQIDRYKDHLIKNWRLTYPIIVTQLCHMAMGVTDSIMVGHMGATELAAAAIANIMFNVFLLFGIGMSLAISPLTASSAARGASEETAGWLRHGLAINLGNGVLLMSIIFVGQRLMWLLNQPREVVELAVPYLLILASSLLPILIFQAFRQFSEGLSATKAPMAIMLAGVALNVALNYLLIYGQPALGISALGLNGAGWATLTSRVLMAAAMAAYVYGAPRFKVYTARAVRPPYQWAQFSKIAHIGLPIGLQLIAEVTAFDFSAIMIGWLGVQPLAAHQIAISLSMMSYMVVAALAMGTTIRVSGEWGRGRIDALRESFLVFLSMGIVFVLVWAGAFLLFRDALPTWFVQDSVVTKIAKQLIFIVALFQLSDAVQAISIGALRGLQDVRVPSLIILLAYWLIGLPLGYVLGFKAGYGALGVWIGLLVGLTLTAVVIFLRLRTKLRELKTKGVEEETRVHVQLD